MFLDITVFCFVLLLLFLTGIYQTKKIRLSTTYLFADRKLSLIPLTATLVMTEFNGATLVSFSGLGYAVGFWALVLPLIFLIGLLFYATTVAEKWKTYDGMSVAGFFRMRYGSAIGKCTSLLLIASVMGFSAVYVKSLILLFLPLFPSLGSWGISALLLFIILCMSLRGGLVAIVRTDLLSFVLALIFFPFLAIYANNLDSSSELFISLAESQRILPISMVVSLIVLTMFTYILAPWYAHKIFSAQSKKTAYWSVVLSSIIIFLLYGSAIFATACFRYKGFSCEFSENALGSLIHQCLPLGTKGYAYALLFAASATTLSGVWSAIVAMVLGDFYKSTSTNYIQSAKIYCLCAAISFVLANTVIDRVFAKMILANIPVAALAFSLLAGFYWKKASSYGAIASILCGCLGGIFVYLTFGEAGGYTWYWSMYVIPLSFVMGVVVSLWKPDTIKGVDVAQT